MLDDIERGSDGVCGGSLGFGVGQPCSGKVSWAEARDYCEGVGARLCTEFELRNNGESISVIRRPNSFHFKVLSRSLIHSIYFGCALSSFLLRFFQS